ncbi:serine hydrolase domain-containing protein [Pseudomonas piscis]|uniref:serine hydrolase domain-containing protein n=1 Tax=Pseudomonas piscis TaxID=2614538 RepID=UPI0021D5CC8B|nr:serine hydrolase [Pseudomonas piscis]MCU7649628.1 beta-lactamase family protein [Pseudomonas piscis]
MAKGSILLVLLVVLGLPARAEDWPAEQWLREPLPSGPALQALEAYAFAPRDDESRHGVRTDALLVVRDGRLVYERYAGETEPQTPHLIWSASKSVLAVLMGVASGEGRFGLQDPAVNFYPALKPHPGITMADLLHWASGLDWQEDYEYAPLNSSVVAMLYTRGRRDMAAFAAQHQAASPPGQAFRYSSGDSNLLAASLRGMLGAQQYPDYPWRALFEPLGIRQAVWERDAAGTFVASSYLYMSARDLARIGLLMQREGRWHDRQLLPRAWVEFCRTPFAGYRAGQDVAVAGGHWWLNRVVDGAPRPWPDAPEDTYAALGHWGQALYIVPQQRLVIVRYGDDRDGSYQHNELLKRVLAAFPTPEQP